MMGDFNLDSRNCAECGSALERKRNEGQRDWMTRKYCARLCYFAFQNRTKHQGPARRSVRRSSPEYIAWDGIIQRCTNPMNPNFKRYGGRGIIVCERWKISFENFFLDVGKRPSPGHSIDRINNEGGYEPGNIKWSTRTEQARNTRKNRFLTAFGKTQTIGDWSIEIGVAVTTLIYRIDHAEWPLEIALSSGPKLGQKIKYHMEKSNVSD